MSYIGNTTQNQNYVPAIDYFNGDGSTTAFTLSRPVASVAAVQAVISNVPQNPGSAFTVSGSTITFTSAPPSGTANIYVYYTSPNTQVVQPGQGTVGTTQLQSDLTLTNPTYTGTLTGGTGVVNIGSGQVYKDASGNFGLGNTSPSYKLSIASANNSQLYLAGPSNGGSNQYATIFFSEAGDNALTINNMYSGGTNYTAFNIGGSEIGRFVKDGSFKFNSGYGSVATAYGCRAWVNFNGTGTVAIRASGNVSSITDIGTGNYRINYSTAMPDVNYAANGTCSEYSGTTSAVMVSTDSSAALVGSITIQTRSYQAAFFDPICCYVSIFR